MRVLNSFQSCVSFGWPREAVTPECPSDSSSTASRESRPEAEGSNFYEGPLLRMLMDFLEHLPDQVGFFWGHDRYTSPLLYSNLNKPGDFGC